MSIKLNFIFLTLAYKSILDSATSYTNYISLHSLCFSDTGLLFLWLEHTMMVSGIGLLEKLTPLSKSFLSFGSQFQCFLLREVFTLYYLKNSFCSLIISYYQTTNIHSLYITYCDLIAFLFAILKGYYLISSWIARK